MITLLLLASVLALGAWFAHTGLPRKKPIDRTRPARMVARKSPWDQYHRPAYLRRDGRAGSTAMKLAAFHRGTPPASRLPQGLALIEPGTETKAASLASPTAAQSLTKMRALLT